MSTRITPGSPEDRLRSHLLHIEDADPTWRTLIPNAPSNRVREWAKRLKSRGHTPAHRNAA